MNFIKRTCYISLLIFAVVSFEVFGSAKLSKIEGQRWWQVSSGNFTVISDEGEDIALELARRLEKFRRTFSMFSRYPLPQELRPVTVISTESQMIFDTLYGVSYSRTAGSFYDRRRGHYAIMRGRRLDTSTRRLSSTALLFHEYTHYLGNNLTGVDLPFWYSEGLADYLSTIRFEDENKIIYGLPIEYHQRRIRSDTWVPMRTLLNGTRGSLEHDQYYRIYPQGWLMVHYFQSDAEKQARLLKYFSMLNQGLKQDQAIKQGLEMEYLELDRALKEYAKTRRLPYSVVTLNEAWDLGEFKAIELPTADILTLIANFLLARSSTKVFGEVVDQRAEKFKLRGLIRATALYERALEIQPKHVGALNGLADLYLNDKPEKANQFIEVALKSEDISADTHRIYGQLEQMRMAAASSEEHRKDLRRSAVRSFNKAIQLEPYNVDAIASAASLYAHDERWDKVVELIEVAISIAPSNSSLRKELIRALIRMGRRDLAEKEIDVIRRDAHHTKKSLSNFEKWLKALAEP